MSIVIVNYNRAHMTLACVQSIFTHTEGFDFEVIVVDNGSTDGNIGVITEAFSDVRVIKNTENLGFSKGNNSGVQLARGRYVLLLNNDTLLIDNAIAKVFLFLNQNPTVGVASCKLLYPDDRLQHNCQRFPSVKYRLLELLRAQKIFGRKRGGQLLMGAFFSHDEVAYPDWVWGTFFMFPKSILNFLPDRCLPETFFMYWEDVQWCWEIRRMGYDVAFTPDAKVVHLMEGSKGPKNRMMVENEKLFMEMYYRPWQRSLIIFLNKCLRR